MRKINLAILIISSVFIVSCTGGKQITSTIQAGKAASQSGQYKQALQHYEEVISYYEQNNLQKECPVYGEAADAALKLGRTEQALLYLKKDRNTNEVTAGTYYQLAGLYHEADNLSKELEALEDYLLKFPDGEKASEVQNRLFELYVESRNWQKASDMWENIPPEARMNTDMLEGYFTVNKALQNDSVCDVVAAKLLQLDEENKTGLEWQAKKYFWQAERRYAEELRAYEANKTNSQYNKLLKALEVVSADFKTALDYFKTLYSLEPDPRYAKYIGDIYNRLDDDDKAAYYYRKADEKY